MSLKLRNKHLLFPITLLILLALFGTAAASGPKSVIFFIGDGMSSTQRRLAELVYNDDLAMNSLPVIGLYTTYSANSPLTDSAAAGTAMATGYKTNNGTIGLSPDFKTVYETVAEAAKRLGKSVGIVTTTRLTHATPASFASHVKNRNQEQVVAVHYLQQNFEVYLGGGRIFFIPEKKEDRQPADQNMKGAAYKGRDLLVEFQNKGYDILRTRDELVALKIQPGTKIFGAFNASHLPYALDRPANMPSLAQMTKAAIDVLKQNPKGFFLMVEGGLIDLAAHANAAAATAAEVWDLDKAVKVGIDHVRASGDTLILVGGDHETGGLSLGAGGSSNIRPLRLRKVTRSEIWLGYGPALQKPDQAFKVLSQYGGLYDLTDKEFSEIHNAVQLHKNGQGNTSPNKSYNSGWLGYNVAKIISARAGIGWATFGHTAHPILLTAGGPGSEKFNGYFDNTHIAEWIAELWGVTLKSRKIK